jgi:hypothetical protein
MNLRTSIACIVICACGGITEKTTIPQSDIDSLSKYTYLIYGEKSGKMAIGSCFFIRKGGRLFLVTAKHVLSGCGDNSVKEALYPDAVKIINNPEQKIIFKLDISNIKDTATCLPMWLNPDIIDVEIQDPMAQSVYSVEQFISNPYSYFGDSEIIGFPGNVSAPGTNPVMLTFSKGTYGITVSDTIDDAVNHTSKVDAINYHVFSRTIAADVKEGKGLSGSPFYIQDSATQKWRISGVDVGVHQNSFFYVGKIEFIIADIDHKLEVLH